MSFYKQKTKIKTTFITLNLLYFNKITILILSREYKNYVSCDKYYTMHSETFCNVQTTIFIVINIIFCNIKNIILISI